MRGRSAHRAEHENPSGSFGKRPIRRPRKSDAVVIPANIPDGLFHLLRADPNVALSLKTEATTAPHYRLSVRLNLSRPSGSVSPSCSSTTRLRLRADRGLTHAAPYPPVLSQHAAPPISLSLSPSPVRAQSALYTRGAQHTVPMTTRSLSALALVYSKLRAHPPRSTGSSRPGQY